ncbi:hypothetical protein [Sphingomonas sp. HMP6]|uniref:hypothetical protein n=1 Tax=Sphingomonas sp. HMP6 TaxID=1517551 RepID=UPI0015965ADD|nr:hypothetical protein [Sphingomonas sp. HMP6]
MRFSKVFAALTLLIAAPALADPGQVTAVDQQAIDQARERGTLIYAYDQAAWHGTDDLRAKIADLSAKAGGWIVDGNAATPQLVFVDKNRADPHAIYVADFRDNKLVSSKLLGPGDDTKISPARKRMIAARDTAMAALVASGQKRCIDKPFNTVILPPKVPSGSILVYFLTPQPDNDTIPFGGHFLIEVSADGKAGPVRSFAKSCALFPLREQGEGTPEALTISHLLDPTPTEIHVFSSLTAHIPVYVMMVQNDRIWSVAGSRIQLLDRAKGK